MGVAAAMADGALPVLSRLNLLGDSSYKRDEELTGWMKAVNGSFFDRLKFDVQAESEAHAKAVRAAAAAAVAKRGKRLPRDSGVASCPTRGNVEQVQEEMDRAVASAIEESS